MTQREEARFKVYTKSRTVISSKNTFPFNLIDFIEGDGTYDTSTYRYSVQNAGTYLLGLSYNKRNNNDNGSSFIRVGRVIDGASTTIVISRSQFSASGNSSSFNVATTFELEVGDEVWATGFFGNPVTNISSYTSDDTLNSFWGIKLNY